MEDFKFSFLVLLKMNEVVSATTKNCYGAKERPMSGNELSGEIE